MAHLKILNKKQIKEIFNLIKKQFGADFKEDYAFFQNEKGKIYITDKDISKINTDKIRINSLGLYFAELKGNEIRFSIEGSQLVGPKATKNILELSTKQVKEWMQGQDLEIKENNDYSGFLLVKHKNDFLGCGKYREGKVFNYVGKNRRVNIVN